MTDPLSEVIALLQPRTVFSKVISGAGRWGVRYARLRPAELLRRARRDAAVSRSTAHDAADARSGRLRAPADDARLHHVGLRAGRSRRHRSEDDAVTEAVRSATAAPMGDPDVRLLGGYLRSSTRPMPRCWCRCCPRWCTCAGSSGSRPWCDSSVRKRAAQRAGRDLVLSRLVEVLLIEALRSTPGEDAPAGAAPRAWPMRGSRSPLRQMHDDPARSWTVAQLARKAALSRSAFFDRFAAPSVCRRWNISSPGAWPWRRICCAATTSRLSKSPNASATAPPAPSARRSAGTWGSRHVNMRASGRSPCQAGHLDGTPEPSLAQGTSTSLPRACTELSTIVSDNCETAGDGRLGHHVAVALGAVTCSGGRHP